MGAQPTFYWWFLYFGMAAGLPVLFWIQLHRPQSHAACGYGRHPGCRQRRRLSRTRIYQPLAWAGPGRIPPLTGEQAGIDGTPPKALISYPQLFFFIDNLPH